jgi:hypothetical protein
LLPLQVEPSTIYWLTLCYDNRGDLQQSDVTEGQIYHREQSDSQTAKDARAQIESQEMWGGPFRNYMGGSDIPRVKAYNNKLPLLKDLKTQKSGIEFRTLVKVDSYHPHFAYWSIDPNDPTTEREGLWNEDGYAKIKVTITYCNQFDPVYIADE